jgi:hypothetical protein
MWFLIWCYSMISLSTYLVRDLRYTIHISLILDARPMAKKHHRHRERDRQRMLWVVREICGIMEDKRWMEPVISKCSHLQRAPRRLRHCGLEVPDQIRQQLPPTHQMVVIHHERHLPEPIQTQTFTLAHPERPMSTHRLRLHPLSHMFPLALEVLQLPPLNTSKHSPIP